MRLLGIDLGKVRIGVAVMDFETRFTSSRKPLSAIGTLAKDAEQVRLIAVKEEVQKVILGLPLLDGEETKMSAVVRRFGAILAESGLDVDYVDESLTSHEADTAMLEAGIKASQRKKELDSQAACLILERYRGQQ